MTLTALAERPPSTMLAQYLLPLAPYLAQDITDLCVNRPGELWTNGATGWQAHPAPALSYQHCQSLATTIASYRGKPNLPILSATLPGGERVQVISPPACTARTVALSIRKPGAIDWTLDRLDDAGAFADCAPPAETLAPFEHELLARHQQRAWRAFLALAVRSRRNILIVGKTGSGKTTVARALAAAIDPAERVITIEDEHELPLPTLPNKVHLFYGRDDEDSRISATHALAACLRMAPDRIWLAELRGPEAWEYIKSIATGHPGSLATMHANGAQEAFDQLAAHVKDSHTGAHLALPYIKQRLLATIDVVLFFHQYKLREVYYDPAAKRAALG